jgi:hypothetical protein
MIDTKGFIAAEGGGLSVGVDGDDLPVAAKSSSASALRNAMSGANPCSSCANAS